MKLLVIIMFLIGLFLIFNNTEFSNISNSNEDKQENKNHLKSSFKDRALKHLKSKKKIKQIEPNAALAKDVEINGHQKINNQKQVKRHSSVKWKSIILTYKDFTSDKVNVVISEFNKLYSREPTDREIKIILKKKKLEIINRTKELDIIKQQLANLEQQVDKNKELEELTKKVNEKELILNLINKTNKSDEERLLLKNLKNNEADE